MQICHHFQCRVKFVGKRKLNLQRIHKCSSDSKAQNSSCFLILSIYVICINYHHYQLVSLLTYVKSANTQMYQ